MAAKRYSPPPPQTVEAREMDQGNGQEDISTFFFYSNIFLFSPLVNVWIITVKVWYHFNNFVSFYIYIFLSDLSSPLPFALLSYILSFSFFGLSVLFHKKEVGISQVPATFHPNRYRHWCCRWQTNQETIKETIIICHQLQHYVPQERMWLRKTRKSQSCGGNPNSFVCISFRFIPVRTVVTL